MLGVAELPHDQGAPMSEQLQDAPDEVENTDDVIAEPDLPEDDVTTDDIPDDDLVDDEEDEV